MLKTITTIDSKGVSTILQERIRIEAWVAVGGAGLESTIFVYPCIVRAADLIMPIQEVFKTIQFTPSVSLANALFAELNAAIAFLK